MNYFIFPPSPLTGLAFLATTAPFPVARYLGRSKRHAVPKQRMGAWPCRRLLAYSCSVSVLALALLWSAPSSGTIWDWNFDQQSPFAQYKWQDGCNWHPRFIANYNCQQNPGYPSGTVDDAFFTRSTTFMRSVQVYGGLVSVDSLTIAEGVELILIKDPGPSGQNFDLTVTKHPQLGSPISSDNAGLVIGLRTSGADFGDPDKLTIGKDQTVHASALLVGVNRVGELNVDGGKVVITNVDSQPGIIQLGQSGGGDGQVKVRNGGTITGGVLKITNNQNSQALVSISGNNSLWNSNDVAQIAGARNDNNPGLSISNGGALNTTGITMTANGAAVVDGSGSNWTSTGAATIDNGAYLSILNGGAVSTKGLTIDSHGSTTIDGLGSHWANTGSATLKDQASLLASNGGAFAVTGNGAALNVVNGALATVTGAKSKLDAGTATVTVDAATLGITKGGTLLSGNVTVKNTGRLYVVDTGSSWQSKNVVVGDSGSESVITVSDSATLNAGAVTIGKAGIGSVRNSYSAAITTTGAVVLGASPGSRGTLTVNAFASWTSPSLMVGDGGAGFVDLHDSGRLTTGPSILGKNVGSRGTVFLGFGSNWQAGDVTIGDAGDGFVTAVDSASWKTGSVVIGNAGTGAVSVSDSATWNAGPVIIGKAGSGAATASYMGTVNTDAVVLGASPSGRGKLTVNAFASWTSPSLTVGESGTGFVDLHDSGRLTSIDATVGTNGGDGSMSLDGGGSQFDILRLGVGSGGHGKVVVKNGGTLANGTGTCCNSAVIGDQTDGVGSLEVRDAGSAWNADSLIVGINNGNGDVNVSNAGRLVSAFARIGALAGSLGAITIDNATWTDAEDVKLGAYTSVNEGSSGTLNVLNGGLVKIGTALVVGSSSLVNLSGPSESGPGASTIDASEIVSYGRIEGTGMLDGNVTNHGIISPGHSIGHLLIDGDFTNSDGTLKIEIAGLSRDMIDTLEVSGNAFLSGGTIEFDFIDGFLPKLGDTFEFFSASDLLDFSNMNFLLGGVVGTFDVIRVPGSPNSLAFDAASDFESVSEPPSIMFLGFSVAVLAVLRRSRRTA